MATMMEAIFAVIMITPAEVVSSPLAAVIGQVCVVVRPV